MGLNLKDYVIAGACGFGTTVILEGLFYIIGFYPTTTKKSLAHGLVNGLSLTSVFAVIDNVKPIKNEVRRELFPDRKDNDCDGGGYCSF